MVLIIVVLYLYLLDGNCQNTAGERLEANKNRIGKCKELDVS